MGLTVGKRIAGPEERLRTAIGSMVNGTIGGDSKIGMPIVELVRVPLVAPGGVFRATGTSQSGITATGLDLLVLPVITTNTTGGLVTEYAVGIYELHATGVWSVTLSIDAVTDVGSNVAGVYWAADPAIAPGGLGSTFVTGTGGFYSAAPSVRAGTFEIVTLPAYVKGGLTLGNNATSTTGEVVGPETYLELTTP